MSSFGFKLTNEFRAAVTRNEPLIFTVTAPLCDDEAEDYHLGFSGQNIAFDKETLSLRDMIANTEGRTFELTARIINPTAPVQALMTVYAQGEPLACIGRTFS